MTDIDKLLEQARNKSEGYGKLYGAKETADDYLKSTYALLYSETAPGKTVAERDAWVRRHPDYKAAIQRKENVNAEWKTAETYMKLLLAEAEVWRTKAATERMMDRGHR